MDYSKLSDFEINKAVAEIAIYGDWLLEPTDESPSWFFNLGVPGKNTVKLPDYCNNPAEAWPIIVENSISLILDNPSSAMATSNCVGWYSDEEPPIHASSQNPLRAAMTVFLMMQRAANVQDNPA